MNEKQFKIEKGRLKNLYYVKKLSISAIAEIYGCSYTTVWSRMKEFRIKPRTLSGAMKLVMEVRKTQIPKNELKHLYEKRKLSTLKIARIYNCHHKTVLQKMKDYGIKSRENTEANTLYPKHKFLGNLVEKAYLLGFRLGDLYVCKINKEGKTIRVEGTSTQLDQIRLITKLFSKYGHIYKYKIKAFRGDTFWRIYCLVDNTFDFLLEKKQEIPQWILNNKKYFFPFLSGYIDAEGCIYLANTTILQANFTLASYDKNILFQIWRKLNSLGIKCPKPRISAKKGYTSKKKVLPYLQDYWYLGVHSKSSLNNLFNEILPFIKHRRKRETVKTAISNIKWRNRIFGNLRMK